MSILPSRSASWRGPLAASVVTLGTAAAMLLAVALAERRLGFAPDRLCAFLTAVSMLAFTRNRPPAEPSAIARGLLLGAGLCGLQWLLARLLVDAHTPHIFDFACFYLDGRVALSGLDFYEPDNYRAVHWAIHWPVAYAVLLTRSADFELEILNVAFPYPPPTMLLFAPLGWFTLDAAHRIWLAVLGASLVLATWLLARYVLVAARRLDAALFALAVLVLSPASLSNAYFEQTNWLLLCCAVLALAARGAGWRGLAAALAVIIKPLGIFAAAYLLLARQWGAALACALVLTSLLLASAALFSAETVLHYFRANPLAHLPAAVYWQDVNQSLSAVLLRGLRESVPWRGSLASYWPFIVLGGLLGVATLVACRAALRADDRAAAFCLLLVAALMLYPGTLVHYAVLLSLPMLLLYLRVPQAWAWQITAALLSAGLTSLLAHGPFWAALALWLVFSGMALRSVAQVRAGKIKQV